MKKEAFQMEDFIISESVNSDLPKTPLLVFINTRSGGQLGKALLETFRTILNPHQVFDLNEVDPYEVLSRALLVRQELRNRLQLIVAGGDGTAGWLLEIASNVGIGEPIPVATIPLGTGNNLPFTFGWGKRNPGTDIESTKRFLKQLVRAHPLKVDRWQLTMKMEGLPEQLPHSLHEFVTSQGMPQIYNGCFWNYFSIGMDAQISYEFHNERHKHPKRFNNQLRNQLTYAKLGCTQGWFYAPCAHPSSRNINEIATVYTLDDDGSWKKLRISSSIRSLVLLNLPSFSGGLDPWGSPNDKKSRKRGLTSTSVEDGTLELVGFRDGWHGLFLLFPKGHGTRLAQAHSVKIELKSSERESHVYMRMDGEPWRQQLPSEEQGRTCIEIKHLGQGVMLARRGCIAERKDAYRHAISITKHGLEHGLRPKSNRLMLDNSGSY